MRNNFNELKDLFGDLQLDKPVEIEVQGRELELDMRVDDMHNLMVLGQKQEVDEEDMSLLTDALRNIFYRTYLPYYDRANDREMSNLDDEKEQENEEAKEFIENIILKNYLTIFMQITEELGWQDEMDEVPGQDFRQDIQS